MLSFFVVYLLTEACRGELCSPGRTIFIAIVTVLLTTNSPPSEGWHAERDGVVQNFRHSVLDTESHLPTLVIARRTLVSRGNPYAGDSSAIIFL